MTVDDPYRNIRPDLRDKWIADDLAWEEKMARVRRIWKLLLDIWDTRNTDWGWSVYYAIEQRDGTVPEPDQITPELVRDGLLTVFDSDQSWLEWVGREFAAYKEGKHDDEQTTG